MTFTTDNISSFFQDTFSKAMLYDCDRRQFLEGVQQLKDSLVIWHDLRKNPDDLPEKMGLGSKEVYVTFSDGITDFAFYCFDKKCWQRCEDEEIAQGTVIAWTEIPVFKEE